MSFGKKEKLHPWHARMCEMIPLQLVNTGLVALGCNRCGKMLFCLGEGGEFKLKNALYHSKCCGGHFL